MDDWERVASGQWLVRVIADHRKEGRKEGIGIHTRSPAVPQQGLRYASLHPSPHPIQAFFESSDSAFIMSGNNVRVFGVGPGRTGTGSLREACASFDRADTAADLDKFGLSEQVGLQHATQCAQSACSIVSWFVDIACPSVSEHPTDLPHFGRAWPAMYKSMYHA